MKSVCVYCGSREGTNPEFPELADRIGKAIAHRNWGLVYGGGKVGIMGRISDAALAEDGNVIGVIPTALKRAEVAHTGVTEMYETPDMHTRKAKMEQLSDAFLILPGGFGTLDEFFEILTWRQLGIHQKPIIILNTAGYFDGLLDFASNAVSHDFVREESLSLFHVAETYGQCIEMLESVLGLEEQQG